MVLKKRARVSYELFLELEDVLKFLIEKGVVQHNSRVRINDVAIINDEVMIVIDSIYSIVEVVD